MEEIFTLLSHDLLEHKDGTGNIIPNSLALRGTALMHLNCAGSRCVPTFATLLTPIFASSNHRQLTAMSDNRVRISTSSSASSVIEMANLAILPESASSLSSQRTSTSESLKSPITPVSPDHPCDSKGCDCEGCIRNRRGSLLKSIQDAYPRVGYAPSESAKEAAMLPTVGVLPDEYAEDEPASTTATSPAEQIRRWCEELDAQVRRRMQQEIDVSLESSTHVSDQVLFMLKQGIREGMESFAFSDATATSRACPTLVRTPTDASIDPLLNIPSKINSVASSVRYVESGRSSRWASDLRCASACRTPSCTSSVKRPRFLSSPTWSRASSRGSDIARNVRDFFTGSSSIGPKSSEESLTVKAAAYEKYKTHGQSNPNMWVKDPQGEEFRRTVERRYRGRGSLENIERARALSNARSVATTKPYKLRWSYGSLVV